MLNLFLALVCCFSSFLYNTSSFCGLNKPGIGFAWLKFSHQFEYMCVYVCNKFCSLQIVCYIYWLGGWLYYIATVTYLKIKEIEVCSYISFTVLTISTESMQNAFQIRISNSSHSVELTSISGVFCWSCYYLIQWFGESFTNLCIH